MEEHWNNELAERSHKEHWCSACGWAIRDKSRGFAVRCDKNKQMCEQSYDNWNWSDKVKQGFSRGCNDWKESDLSIQYHIENKDW